MEEVPNDGLIRYLAFCNGERVFPTSPKVLQEVMHTKAYIFQKAPMVRKSIGKLLGMQGMLFSEGEQHKIQRKHILPAFAYRHLRDLIPIFWEKSLELSKAIENDLRTKQDTEAEKQTGVVIEMSQWLSRSTLDIIGSAGFGYEFNCVKNDDDSNELVKAYRKVFSPASKTVQIIRVIYQYLPEWLINLIPLKRRKEGLQAIELLKSMCTRMVREKKQEYETGGKVGQKDILSLVTKDSPFTEEEMRDQLMTFLAAGHETTASALGWGLYLLSQNPEVQSRLRAEIRSQIPSPTSTATTAVHLEDCLDTLPYLRNVTNEIFRFYPPVPMTLRMAAEDTTLGGYYIPKGTIVMLSPWAINRSKKVWGPKADVFDPNRWEEHKEGKEGASNYDSMTFLHGPRGCIGKDFARLEFKALLAVLVGRFEFNEILDENGKRKEIVIKGGITSRPQDGVPLRVRVLDGW